MTPMSVIGHHVAGNGVRVPCSIQFPIFIMMSKEKARGDLQKLTAQGVKCKPADNVVSLIWVPRIGLSLSALQ